MRVLLISVPTVRIRYNISGIYPLPPLGLASIAAVLEKNNVEVDIIDLDAINFNHDLFCRQVKENNYSIVGLSCRSIFSFDNAIKLSKELKKIFPSVFLVGGGPGFAFAPQLMFEQMPDCDLIVHGEGEAVFLDICNKLIVNDYDFSNIESISYRLNNVVMKNPRLTYLNMDQIPMPARHLLPNDLYRLHPPFGVRSPITLIETSRGCTYNCIFCSLKRTFTERRCSGVLNEIKHVESRYGVKEIHFIDPIFTYNQERIKDISNAILANGLNIVWSCKTRVDLVSQELLKLMSKAGCYMISYGVESGSQEILNNLKKNISLGKIKDVFSWSREVNIKTLAYVIIGAKGENEQTVRRTIHLVKTIEPNFVLYGELMPDPNSILVKQAIAEGKITAEDLFDLYVLRKKVLVDVNICGVDQKKIKRWVILAYKSFYLRPSYIFKSIICFISFRDFLNLFKGAYFLFLDHFRRKVF